MMISIVPDRIYKIISNTIKLEGGFVNHPNDPGGATNYGITLKTLREYFKNPEITVEQIKELPEKVAVMIYYEEYFLNTNVFQFPDAVQSIIFDMCVNHGQKQAYKILQRAVNDVLGEKILVIDGIFGPNTLSKTKKAVKLNKKDVINQVVYHRIAFYKLLVDQKPSLKVFLRGWLNRANKFKRR
jgi:lysozyme family protein